MKVTYTSCGKISSGVGSLKQPVIPYRTCAQEDVKIFKKDKQETTTARDKFFKGDHYKIGQTPKLAESVPALLAYL